MDLTMQMKSAELLLNFIKHDTEKIPLYGFMLQKQRFVPKPNTAPLPRSTPEAEGVPSEAVESFFRDIEAQADSVACHAITVLRHGKVIAEGAYAPYRLDVPHMLYSMSKSITGLAVGMAIDEGYLDINERIIDIFPEYVTSLNAKALKSHTVWNLLTMSTGARFNEVGSGLDENWLKMYMQSTPKFEAGSAFDYNSLNSYVLAAALVKRTGMSLTEFLTPRLYKPLGIRYHEWETCPKGIEKGGWGLSLTVEDAAKLGQLCLNRGRWNGEPIVSEKWIDAATSVQIQTPNGEMKHGYGYQIWMSDEEGAFQFNGAFGQYVLVFPKYDAVIAMYSGSASLFAHVGLSERVKQLLDTFKDEALQENGQAGASLKKCLDGLTYSPSCPDELGMDKEEFERIAYRLDGREYLAGPNTGGFFPQTLQVVHGNMTDSVSMFRFAKRGDDIIHI
jgi:CubicO group peptidase (beta-lactamase class C family)